MHATHSVTPDLAVLPALLEQIRDAAERGDMLAGLELCERAHDLARDRWDVRGQSIALMERARFQTWQGDLEAAIASCEEGRHLLVGHSADRESCELAVVQAFALTGLGLGREAMELLTQARELARRLGDRGLLFWVHNRTGLAYDSLGEHEVARELLGQALLLSEAAGEHGHWSIITNLVNNAMAVVPMLRAAGRQQDASEVLVAALAQAAEAVASCDGTERHYDLCLSLGNLGAIQQLAGEPQLALSILQRAHDLAVEHGYRPLQMSALQHMPGALLDQGRVDDAIRVLRDVLVQSVELAELPVQVEVLLRLADVYEQQGDFEQALSSHRAFHDAERRLRSGHALTRARLLAHQAHLEQARTEAAEARARSEQLLAEKLALLQQAVELERHAHTDALTGLANRRYLDLALPTMHEHAQANALPLWVALLDLDHFKQVNDTHGHSVGDLVLARLGQLLRTLCRPDDLIARYGGEEFLLAMLNVDSETARRICERLRQRVQDEDWSHAANGIRITISVGLAPATGSSHADAVRAADQQLYQAKNSGRNRVASYGGIAREQPTVEA